MHLTYEQFVEEAHVWADSLQKPMIALKQHSDGRSIIRPLDKWAKLLGTIEYVACPGKSPDFSPDMKAKRCACGRAAVATIQTHYLSTRRHKSEMPLCRPCLKLERQQESDALDIRSAGLTARLHGRKYA